MRALAGQQGAPPVKGPRGTLLASLDVHPRVAMQILRHSRISVAMEIYTEATFEATRAALKRLGDELSQYDQEDQEDQ
jgi:hypothetical protein